MRRHSFYILCIFLLSACDLLKKKEEKPVAEEQGKPLARVYNKYLYSKDLEEFEDVSFSKEDSADITSRYINNWVFKQLELMRAEGVIDENKIMKELEDCKNTLIIHEFEKEYLKKKLDTSFSDKELKDYYDAHIGTFELKQNIFKGLFIKVSKNAPDVDKVRSLINAGKQTDLHELKSFCVRFADHYILEDTVWINFDDLVKNSPFTSIPDKGEFLEKNRHAELTDSKYIYFLKINDYKVSKQVSPFEFAKDRIKNTLLNRRKIQLISELKVSIYKEAKKNNEFEVFGKK